MWLTVTKNRDRARLQEEAEKMLEQGWVHVHPRDTERILTMTLLDAEIRKVPFGDLYELRVALMRRYAIYHWMRWVLFGVVVGNLLGGVIRLFQGQPFIRGVDLALLGLVFLFPLVCSRTLEWYHQRKAIRLLKQGRGDEAAL